MLGFFNPFRTAQAASNGNHRLCLKSKTTRKVPTLKLPSRINLGGWGASAEQNSPQAPPPPTYLTPHSSERTKAPVPHDGNNTPQRHSTSQHWAISSSSLSIFLLLPMFTLTFFLLLYFLIYISNIYFVLKIWGMLISNFWLVKNTYSIISREKTIYD